MSASSPSSDLRHWVEKAQAGDANAWIELDRQLRPRLEALLRPRIPDMLRPRFDVDDVLQSGYLEATRQIASFEFRGEHSFEAWIGEIMFNELRDKLRFHARDKRSIEREEDVGSSVRARAKVDVHTPSQVLECAEDHAGLARQLETLSPVDSELIRMRFQEGLSWAEIGRRLELPETTTRRRCSEILECMVRAKGGTKL